MDRIQTLLTDIGVWLARPAVFLVVLVYAALWVTFDSASLDFHGAIALITLCMTLFIQRSEHRDTQAIHAKLDELLRAVGKNKDGLTAIDDEEPERIEAHRKQVRATDDQVPAGSARRRKYE